METVLRVALIYAFILLGMRVVGKREFAQLSPSELVSLLMIPELVSQALTHEDYSLTNALIGVCTLLLLVFVTSVLVQRFRRLESLLYGDLTVLVHNGGFRERAMNAARVSPDEVFAEMRKAGYERLDQIKWAILETDGKISIVPQAAHERVPDQRKDDERPGR